MKTVIHSLFLCLLLSSCQQRILMQTQSIGIPKTDGYVFENDTVKIVYNFWDMKGNMKFELWNKLNVPLFIDWKNSAFIKNGNKYDYWIDRTISKTKESGYYAYGSTSKKGTNVSVKDERVTFVPPKTKITINKYHIVETEAFPNEWLGKTYNNITSVLTFRNYLAFSLNESLSATNYIDNGFYLVRAVKIDSRKLLDHADRGNFWLP